MISRPCCSCGVFKEIQIFRKVCVLYFQVFQPFSASYSINFLYPNFHFHPFHSHLVSFSALSKVVPVSDIETVSPHTLTATEGQIKDKTMCSLNLFNKKNHATLSHNSYWICELLPVYLFMSSYSVWPNWPLIKTKTLQELQNAAQRTSHRLSKCQNVHTKSPFKKLYVIN